ncbi:MAG TPA: hypothetical protein VL993_03130 [Stellaceae bacterium]|nr:hypothetical protein [Stellaceae bacterium]
MPIARLDFLALFLELTNEATVIAETMDDQVLAGMASSAAFAAGRQLGLSEDQVAGMQQDMLQARMGGSCGLRIVPDLEGPSTATAVARRRRRQVLDGDRPVTAPRPSDRGRSGC